MRVPGTESFIPYMESSRMVDVYVILEKKREKF